MARYSHSLNQTFTSISDVVLACFRRSLVYPLYRNWELSQKVLLDVTIIFKLGKRALLKALLEMKRIIERDEVSFSVGRIWLTDYCVWLQSAR
jgi:protein SHQ1